MMIRVAAHTIIFVALTLLTQIGGVAYILALMVGLKLWKRARLKHLFTGMAFLLLYGGLHTATGFAAPHFGRISLPCTNHSGNMVSMQSPLYCLLNRHYVTYELEDVVFQLSDYMNHTYPGTVTIILDAGFPFFDGFPLLPHLSHHDGKKLDLSYYYLNQEAVYAPGATKSPIGYWAFEEPAADSAKPCANHDNWLTLRWDMNWFNSFLRPYELDNLRTSEALHWLSSAGQERGVSKILLEPHLEKTLGVESDSIRFQGCRAARHDDHIHIEVR